MNRRQFLSLSTLSLSLSGCIETDSGGSMEETPPPNVTEAHTSGSIATGTETVSPEGATPECWPSMCEGTKLVEVVNASSDVVTVQADCRETEYSLQSGESVEITREEDAEACRITLSITEEAEYRESIEGNESVTLTVLSNGEVSAERIVV